MNILLVSYGDLDYDGRLRSLIDVFSRMGKVYVYSRGSKAVNEISVTDNSSYLRFIRNSVRFAKTVETIDWLVLDNRKATIPGMIIQRRHHPGATIQDCRELYLSKEIHYFAGKAGCFFEKRMARKADIVICANQERAKIMQAEYRLADEPLVYENLRQLQYESDEAYGKAAEKLSKYIREGETGIISTSGCSILRTNDVLVRNLSKVRGNCRLFLAGESTEEEKQEIRKIIHDEELSNVEILGRLNQSELKYLISRCHIGVVNYGQYDTNNKYCASGKIFEFLYEGKPVVTTDNPPLKKLCGNGIGAADNEYYNGINEITDNYDQYVRQVQDYIKTHTIRANDDELIREIRNKIL